MKKKEKSNTTKIMVNFNLIFNNNITAKLISRIGKSVAINKCKLIGIIVRYFNVSISGIGSKILVIPLNSNTKVIEK